MGSFQRTIVLNPFKHAVKPAMQISQCSVYHDMSTLITSMVKITEDYEYGSQFWVGGIHKTSETCGMLFVFIIK